MRHQITCLDLALSFKYSAMKLDQNGDKEDLDTTRFFSTFFYHYVSKCLYVYTQNTSWWILFSCSLFLVFNIFSKKMAKKEMMTMMIMLMVRVWNGWVQHLFDLWPETKPEIMCSISLITRSSTSKQFTLSTHVSKMETAGASPSSSRKIWTVLCRRNRWKWLRNTRNCSQKSNYIVFLRRTHISDASTIIWNYIKMPAAHCLGCYIKKKSKTQH